MNFTLKISPKTVAKTTSFLFLQLDSIINQPIINNQKVNDHPCATPKSESMKCRQQKHLFLSSLYNVAKEHAQISKRSVKILRTKDVC